MKKKQPTKLRALVTRPFKVNAAVARRMRSKEGLNLDALSIANANRSRIWDPKNKLTMLFHSNEMVAEAGEAANVVKKLERARLGLRGSRSSLEHLADELADVVICVSLLANKVNIDLSSAVVAKFNRTSNEHNLGVYLRDLTSCQHPWHSNPALLIPCPSCRATNEAPHVDIDSRRGSRKPDRDASEKSSKGRSADHRGAKESPVRRAPKAR